MYLDAPAWGPKTPGATALHLVAQGGHAKIMEKLLERGANIDARTKGVCGCKLICKRAINMLINAKMGRNLNSAPLSKQIEIFSKMLKSGT
jgi:ankyrin repeat protein